MLGNKLTLCLSTKRDPKLIKRIIDKYRLHPWHAKSAKDRETAYDYFLPRPGRVK